MKAEWRPWEIGRLTLDQLCCLMDPNPPGGGDLIESIEDLDEALARRKAEESEWHSAS